MRLRTRFLPMLIALFALVTYTLVSKASTPPTVMLRSPADGATLTALDATLTCDATDDLGLVEAQLQLEREVVVTRDFVQNGSLAGTTDDAQLTADTPTANAGAASSLKVDGLSPHSHAVLRYPNLFGSDPSQIPLGAEVVSASLTVNCFNAGNRLTAYRLLEDWVETEATWNQRQAGVAWANPGADGATSRDTVATNWDCATIGVKTFDMTPFVQAWAAGAPNLGVVITETGQDGVEFYTSEHATAANRPKLTVTYRTWEAQPAPPQPLTGTAATASFPVTLQDQSGYRWNCAARDSDGQTASAPAAATFTTNATWTPPTSTTQNLKVAFTGDQGILSTSRAVLQLIKDEGAQMVLHQGDFDYTDNPTAWDDQINSILGPNFPYFAATGNHDTTAWAGYQQKLAERLSRIPDATCTGNLGIQSACRYQGLHFLLVAPGISGSGHDTFISNQLAQDNSAWSICSWHVVQRLMQVGGKGDESGWGVYEACRQGGGIVATAHEHSYSRTHLMSEFTTQAVATTAPKFVIEPGKTFAFVSGLGGHTIRPQLLSGPWWASVYTSTQGADFGALFCTFHVNGRPDVAQCYFKDIQGRIVDSFELRSNVEDLGNRTPVAFAGPDQTVQDDNGDGRMAVTLDGGASYDLDGMLTYEWREGTTVLGTGNPWTGELTEGVHTITLTVTDSQGGTDTDTLTVTITPGNTPPPPPPPITRDFTQDGSLAGTTDDTQLTANTPKKNSGAATFIKVDGLNPHSHGLIRYPNLFGSDTSQIPLGSEIISASLTVNCYNAGNRMTAYRLLEDWTESQTTWNVRQTEVSWTNPGADGPGSRDSTGVSWDCTTIGVKTFDMTPFVQAWAAGAPNLGVVLIETGQDGVEFYTSEHATAANRPKLKVTYR